MTPFKNNKLSKTVQQFFHFVPNHVMTLIYQNVAEMGTKYGTMHNNQQTLECFLTLESLAYKLCKLNTYSH